MKHEVFSKVLMVLPNISSFVTLTKILSENVKRRRIRVRTGLASQWAVSINPTDVG